MQYIVCSRCANFPCPMNNMPKALVDAYLQDNPVMLKAWRNNGYSLGSRDRSLFNSSAWSV